MILSNKLQIEQIYSTFVRAIYLNSLIVLYAVYVFFYFIDQAQVGGRLWIADIAAQFVPHAVIIGVAMLIFCIFQRYILRAFVLLGMVLYIGSPIFSFSKYAIPQTDIADAEISALWYNSWDRAASIQKLSTNDKAREADFIAIAEFPFFDCREVRLMFSSHSFCYVTPERSGHKLDSRIAIISKSVPLSLNDVRPSYAPNRAFLEVEIDVSGEPIVLIAAHADAPTHPASTLRRNALISDISDRVRKFRRYVILGDFNITPWASMYDIFPGQRISDPRIASTWISRSPLLGLPIDHMFVSSCARVFESEVGPYTGSDHRFIKASLSLVDC